MGNLLGPAHCVIKTGPSDTRVNFSFIQAEFWGAGIDRKQPKTGSNRTLLLREKSAISAIRSLFILKNIYIVK